MKNLRLLTLIALISIFTLLALVGCKKEDGVAAVSLKDNDPNTAIEIEVGDFDINAYTVVVVYESGNTEEIALTEEMITETDLLKLFQVGEHDITLNYGESQYIFKVSVKRDTFGELSFPKDNIFTYTGEAHTVEVDGELPSNAVVTYLGGNSFVNAGTYDVIAIVSCEGYVTEKISTTVKIERAKYDMSGVKFEGKEVVYDGTAQSVAISGELPSGVSSPTYTINGKSGSSATDVGEYTVKAAFSNSNPNYEAIPEMVTTLKITPAEYNVKGVDIVFKNDSGKVINASKIYDCKSIKFDINDYKKLSKKVSVSFSVSDKDGKVISTSNQNTGIINVGVYTVKVEFTMLDAKNYKPIAPIVRTFEVLKAEYPPIENVKFTSALTTYDGQEHSIAIAGQLPTGVTVSYEYYKSDIDGVRIRIDDADGKPVQSVINAGRYYVKAVFSHSNTNYKDISSISAILNIERASIDISTLDFEYNENWVYDGTPKSIGITDPPDYLEFSYEYYLDGNLVTNDDDTPATAVTDVGEYEVLVIIKSTNGNFVPMSVKLRFAIVSQNN